MAGVVVGGGGGAWGGVLMPRQARLRRLRRPLRGRLGVAADLAGGGRRAAGGGRRAAGGGRPHLTDASNRTQKNDLK